MDRFQKYMVKKVKVRCQTRVLSDDFRCVFSETYLFIRNPVPMMNDRRKTETVCTPSPLVRASLLFLPDTGPVLRLPLDLCLAAFFQ